MRSVRLPGGRQPPARDWPLAAGLIAGVAVDALAGDPRRGHPVALFGRAMTAVEQSVYADRRSRGAAFTGCGVALAALPALAASLLCQQDPVARLIIATAATWAVTGARSLAAEATRIRRALHADDLDRARRMLPTLCGRDPAHLDVTGIARAVVESVAENSSDAIVAPLLWGALAGPAGLAGYRAVNTLDAMAGHHSPHYERFGWTSARLDDVVNWGPARATALLAAACAPVVGGRPAASWRTAYEYGSRHPSPNAGWCEAAFAGALGVRLGGPLSYAGRAEYRPALGAGRAPEPADIARAVRLCRAVTTSATVLAAALALSATDLPPAFPFGRCRLGQDRAGKAPCLGHREAGPCSLPAAGAAAEVHEDPRGRMPGIAEGEPADREFPPAACAQVLVSPSARGACLLVRPHPAPPRPSRGRGPAHTCHTHLGIASKGRHYSGSRPSRTGGRPGNVPRSSVLYPWGYAKPELGL